MLFHLLKYGCEKLWFEELLDQSVHLLAASKSGISEEAPLAYKDEDLVVGTIEQAGIAKRVARMRPVGVING